MGKPKTGTDTPIGPGVLIDDLSIKDKRKVPSTIVQSLEVIRIKLGGDSSYTCDSVQESIDGITNIYDDKMPSSNNILSALNKLGEVVEPGGGESSDFSTAEVTVNGIGGFIAEVASLTENGLSGTCFKSPLENSFTVVLYQGETIMQGVNGQTPVFTIPEGETNIVYDEEKDYFLITGDCTITIS